jgi:Suv3 C-terminal domain 1
MQERHFFCNAPVNQRDPRQMGALLRFAELYSQKRAVLLDLPLPPTVPTNFSDLQTLESLHQVQPVPPLAVTAGRL